MHSNRTNQIVLFAILFLFFLQVLSDFIQSIYAFGLLVTAFTIQLASVLLLFTPLALLFLRKAPSRGWLIGMGVIAVLGRLAEPMLDPGGRLVACGVSVGAFMLLWPSMLASARLPKSFEESSGDRENNPRLRNSAVYGWSLASALLIAVMLSIFFRTAGSSLDVSEVGAGQLIAWMLAAVAGWVGIARMQPPKRPSSPTEPAQAASHEDRRAVSLRALEASATLGESGPTPGAPSSRRVVGLCIGMAAVIVMLYFAFVSPTVMARWTTGSYTVIMWVLLIAMAGFTGLFTRTQLFSAIPRPVVLIWNGLFVVALVLTIAPHQVAFPAQVGGYPLSAGTPGALAVLPLYLTLILWPVIFVDFMLYLRQLSSEAPTIRQLGSGLAWAALFVLVMVFLHVFTTIYDYAAPIGPLFRDRFWLVYLIAGVSLATPAFLIGREHFAAGVPEPAVARATVRVLGSLAVLTGAVLFLTMARPPQAGNPNGGVRVMTYNIQQGFDKVGDADLSGQLAAIRKVGPDVLGLEESDTARIANGNVDAVRYFADNLGMYSYYGPTTTVGTFGIALLSKYPIQNAQTFFLYSVGEQTACIEAQISVGGKTYNVFVTHLGNNGEMIQLQNVLSRVDSLPNVILMGDFNFTPTTAQYAFATRRLKDAWLMRWPGGHELYPIGSEGRIDEVFVSPGTQISDAEYVPDPASDHPYLYVVVVP